MHATIKFFLFGKLILITVDSKLPGEFKARSCLSIKLILFLR